MVPRAYHVTVHALEARSGLRSMDRFALAVEHALRGHVSFERCAVASRERIRAGFAIGPIERSVLEWLETDLNPVVQSARTLASPEGVVAAYNLYQASAKLAVVTQVRAEDWAASRPIRSATREVLPGHEDPPASREANFAILERLTRIALLNARSGSPGRIARLSEVARFLAVEESAAAHVSQAFEVEGAIRIPLLSKRLGCSPRTLQRQLRDEGLTAEKLRSAARLLSATGKLATARTLTEVAFEEGFSDLAHMTRSFRESCGMTPSALRLILRSRG